MRKATQKQLIKIDRRSRELSSLQVLRQIRKLVAVNRFYDDLLDPQKVATMANISLSSVIAAFSKLIELGYYKQNSDNSYSIASRANTIYPYFMNKPLKEIYQESGAEVEIIVISNNQTTPRNEELYNFNGDQDQVIGKQIRKYVVDGLTKAVVVAYGDKDLLSSKEGQSMPLLELFQISKQHVKYVQLQSASFPLEMNQILQQNNKSVGLLFKETYSFNDKSVLSIKYYFDSQMQIVLKKEI